MTAQLCTNTVIQLLSPQRISSYQNLNSGAINNALAIDHYIALQDISSHLFVLLQLLEISLRNRLHDNLSAHLGTHEWYDSFPKTREAKDIVSQAHRNIRKDFGSKPYSSDDFICKLSFGFWMHLLDSNHRSENFWAAKINDVFPNRNGKNTGMLFDLLKKAGNLRNRLYHHEPIWKNKPIKTKRQKTSRPTNFNNAITNMKRHYQDICDLLRILSNENNILIQKYQLEHRFNNCCAYYLTTIQTI